MSPRPRRAAAQAAAATLASNADGDAADDEGDAWGGKGRRSARGGDDRGDDKENLENMEEDESDDDDAAPTRRSGRARRANNRKVADSDDDDAQEDDEENVENENFVRRSSRAAKPVARLSPDWKQHASDGDDEPEAEETDPEGEYVEEEEDEETSEEDEESDEEIEGIPTRYSKRQRATVERYSPKPNERGLAGGGGDRRGRHSDSPPARGRRKKAKGGGKRRSSGPNYRESSDDDRGPRGGGKRWMDDTDDSDADAGAAGNPGNFPALFGGMFGGGRAPDMYPLAPPGQPGGGGGAVEAGGPGPGGKKEAADAEITPLTVDPTLTFEQVGGLSHYVHSLKEMVFLPLLYPEVFARFKMNPPRGVLLYGAPGTGKTLIARALAASCSRAGAEVSFYMRKGADVLSKWVGESERQLRLLFEEAQKRQPAIIFFDEIDGLAPVRSSKSDQIHNSIVATLLALMDGLDSRGRVVVLGATNRVDAIDGALRRPGRFDRELAFPLPNASARFEILKIHTRGWEKPPPALLLEQLATRCVGYCGADLKALCTEAAVHALRRRYPQIYESDDKLLIDPGQILPGRVDFRAAMEAITPASHRSAQAHARPLGPLRTPLMGPALATAIEATFLAFPPAAMAANADVRNASGDASGDASDRAPPTAAKVFDLDDLDDEDEDDGLELLEELDGQVANEEGNEGGVAKGGSKGSAGDGSSALSGASAAAALAAAALEFLNCPLARQPRLLLHGPAGSGQSPLAAALLHELEAFPVHAVGLPSLLADGGRSPEEALVGAVTEARRAAPAVLFLPSLRLWWDSATPTLRATLRTLMDDVPADTPLLLLATCDCECDELEPEASGLFGEGQTVRIDEPNDAALRGYFEPVVAAAVKAARAMDARDRDVANGVESKKRRGRALETLPKAPAPSLDQGAEGAEVSTEGPGDAATAAMIAEEDHALRQQRMFLRDLVTRLLYRKQWRDFASPVDDEQLPGYSKKVKEPMDLSTLLWKVDSGTYATMDAFLKDVHLIVNAAKTYWGSLEQDRAVDPSGADAGLDENGFDVVEGRKVVSRAHALEDTIQELAGQLDPSLVQRCAAIARHRSQRGGGGDRGGADLPLMPGEGPRGERRSRRGADDDITEDAVGEKRKRIHDEPGYVPDPEALARELRAKRAKEEAAKKSAAERAAAEREAAAAAAAAVTEAAEAAANAAAGGTGGIERAMSADGSAPMQFLDAIDPASDAEIAASSSAFVNFLVKRCAGKPVADAEALATDLGRCVKGALSRDASRTTDWTRHLQGVLQGFMSARTA